MKIALLSNGYPPRHWAGTETYTRALAEGLQRLGHDVRVVCTGDWDQGASYWNGAVDELINDVPVLWLNVNWKRAPDPCRYLYDNPLLAARVRTYLTDFRPDVVHITSCYSLSASVLWVVKDLGLPLVLSLTDFWFLCPRLNLVRGNGELCNGQTTAWECLRCRLWDAKAYRVPRAALPDHLIQRLLVPLSRQPALTRLPGLRGMALDMASRKAFLHKALGLADRVFIASPFAREVFAQSGVSRTITVKPYGLDLSWRTDCPRKTPSSALRFGYIGRIERSKGVHLLVQAFSRLAEDGRVELQIYGNLEVEPSFGGQLRKAAAERSDIHFRGTYAHERTSEVYAGIDVLVVPSLWQDYPLVIHEAFAAQTPVIASDLGSMRDFVQDEVNGLLFERGSIADLAARLLRCRDEPKLLERLQAGIPRVKTIEQDVREIEATYTELQKRAAVGRA